MRFSPTYIVSSAFTCLLLLSLLTGCGGGDQPEVAPGAVVNGDVGSSSVGGAQDDAAIIRNFHLTRDKARAAMAVQERWYERLLADPELRARADAFERSLGADGPDLTTVAGMVWMVEQFPEMLQEVRRAGLSTQDFVLSSQSLTSVIGYAMMRDAGYEAEYAGLASQRNVAVYDQNRAEFERYWARLQELAMELDGGDDDRDDHAW